MNEKNSYDKRAERLSERIGELDEDLLTEAYRTDTAEKLTVLKAKEARKKPRYIRRILLTAACLVLAVGITLTLPPLLRNSQTGINTDIPAWFLEYASESLTIDSLDKLNYYAAKISLSDDILALGSCELLSALPVSELLSAGTAFLPGIRPLSDTKNREEIYTFPLDSEEVFTVTRVIGFRIGLDNPKNIRGFLESKLGTGVIDVVITQNSLETMITFRNGENYFSCLLNGYERNKDNDGNKITRIHFSTHKYIDGFAIVKNLEQINYGFYIWIDESTGDVIDFLCQFSETSAQSSPEFQPDTVTVVPDSSFVSDVQGSFTVAELERYFHD